MCINYIYFTCMCTQKRHRVRLSLRLAARCLYGSSCIHHITTLASFFFICAFRNSSSWLKSISVATILPMRRSYLLTIAAYTGQTCANRDTCTTSTTGRNTPYLYLRNNQVQCDSLSFTFNLNLHSSALLR